MSWALVRVQSVLSLDQDLDSWVDGSMVPSEIDEDSSPLSFKLTSTMLPRMLGKPMWTLTATSR